MLPPDLPAAPVRAPAVALVVLTVALLVVAASRVPWRAGWPAPPADPALDFTAAEIARSAAFVSDTRPWAYASVALGLATVVALGATRRGRRLVTPVGGGWLRRVVLAGSAVLVARRLVTLPLSARIESIRTDYGLSTRGWDGWARDVLTGFAVETVITVAGLAALVAVARRWRRAWWPVAAVGAAGLVVAGSFAFPALVEPLFNRFDPLPDGPLRSALLELAARDGVAVDEVLVADASRRTTALNAYVSGLGATRRIVVFDTFLDRPAAEIETVVAHELGHVAAADVGTGTTLGALAAAAVVCGVAVVARRRGVEGPLRDATAVPVLLAALAVGSFLALPLQNAVSRRIESAADEHALQLTRDPVTVVALQRSLAVRGLSDLDPPALAYAWFATHPTAPMRAAQARAFAAAEHLPVPAPRAVGSSGP